MDIKLDKPWYLLPTIALNGKRKYSMNNLEIIDVFAVYGDGCNIGIGSLIGVFENENDASKTTVGRGNVDFGGTDGGSRGNGVVVNKKAIRIEDEIYLLELNHSVKINKILREPTTGYIDGDRYFGIMVTGVSDAINFMKVVRKRTGMTLRETKTLYDKCRREGKARVEPFHDNIDNLVSKDEFVQWKQELELNGYATIDAI